MVDAPDDLGVLVNLLRLLTGRSQREMAAAASMHPSALSRLERGHRPPSLEDLQQLARAACVPAWMVQGVFLPALALARRSATCSTSISSADEEIARAALEGAEEGTAVWIAEFLVEPSPADEPPRDGALECELWPLLGERAGEVPDLDAAICTHVETVVAALCDESVRLAAHSAPVSLEAARGALRVARLTPVDLDGYSRPQGYAWGFIGNALRVSSDLSGAEVAFSTSRRLWPRDAASGDSKFAQWRLLSLEASFRRDRRQFADALCLLDQANRSAPVAERGAILLSRALVLATSGHVEDSIATLRAASPYIDASGDLRNQWAVRFNLVAGLCQLGQYDEAEGALPELHVLAQDVRNDLDSLRLQWLTARVWAGLGRREQATIEFEQVQRGFAQRRMSYDAALVSLDLAIAYLDQDRHASVQALARDCAWIFQSQGVARETLAALAIFCEAAESNRATIDLVRALLGRLQALPADMRYGKWGR